MIWFLNGVSWNSNRHLDIDYNKIFKCLFNKVWWEKDIRHWSHGYDFSFDCTSSDSSNLHFDKTAWNINDNHIISQQSILYNVSWNSNSGIKPAYIDDKDILFYWNVLCRKWQKKPLVFFFIFLLNKCAWMSQWSYNLGVLPWTNSNFHEFGLGPKISTSHPLVIWVRWSIRITVIIDQWLYAEFPTTVNEIEGV